MGKFVDKKSKAKTTKIKQKSNKKESSKFTHKNKGKQTNKYKNNSKIRKLRLTSNFPYHACVELSRANAILIDAFYPDNLMNI